MSMAEPYGHLAINGKAMTDEQVAAMIGLDAITYTSNRESLESAGVFSRTDTGIICCRRMVKDHATIEASRESGKRGGNPELIEDKKNPEPITHNPEPTQALTGGDKGTLKGTECLSRFVPPTPDEVTEYSKQLGYPMDGQAWCDSYEQKGWMVGRSKMKSWKAAVRNWKTQKWSPVPKAKDQSHNQGFGGIDCNER
jgi:hypothetical protein